MKVIAASWSLVALVAAASCTSAAARRLPIYIEDNHAGTFYWLAQWLDLDQPCTLIHFDAHSDASGIFDSDNIRGALRNVASSEERKALLDRMRQTGAVQCFNWIEPLMPTPIAKVVWVAGEKRDPAELEQQRQRATALLDGHLEAAPRKSGSFRDRYLICDFQDLAIHLDGTMPLIVTIDLDYFAGMSTAKKPEAFARVWNFVAQQPNLRAITFAISRPYLHDEAEADQLLQLALKAALSLPTADIYFEPFLSATNDRSARAAEFRKAGLALPSYDVRQASERLRATILAEKNRITVKHDRRCWENLLGNWENETARLSLTVKGAQVSSDGIWRVAAEQPAEIELIAEPWLTQPTEIQWFARVPKYLRCNVTNLGPNQVGFVANAAPRPVWTEVQLPHSGRTLSTAEIEPYFEQRLHCGALQLQARASVDGRIRETPIMELRRFAGSGFRAAISEQFGLPYLFGSGELADATNTGPETNLGADCANLVIFALRRQGQRLAWSDPKGLRAHLDRIASSVRPGEATFSADGLERGLIIDLGTHVAALMEDRPPLGVLDQNDLVAHQLKGVPELLSLGELLRDRQKGSFDLLQPPAVNSPTILFGGDVMLGRSCGQKIENGIDPFRGIQNVLRRCSFAAANLECTISELSSPVNPAKYSFRAPRISAKSLAAAGFCAMGLANNHALDFGAEASADCALNLAREKILSVGLGPTAKEAYRPKFYSLPNENKVAILALDDLASKSGPGAELAVASDRNRLKAAIEQAHNRANFLACLVHWGIENSSEVTDRQRELGRWLVEQGVDVVVGSHPHAVQPLDFYHGRPIAYSLGNLVFDGAPTVPSWNRGALLEIGLAHGGNVSSVRMIRFVLEEGLPQLINGSGNAVWRENQSQAGASSPERP